MSSKKTNKRLVSTPAEPGQPSQRPQRKRQRRNGRLELVNGPPSRKNAQPAVRYVFAHGGRSGLLKARLDARTRLGKLYRRIQAALVTHLGGDVTTPQAALIDQAARLALLCDATWAEVIRTGAVDKRGNVVPAVDAFIKAAKNQRELLVLLGIERRTKPVPDLQSYLEAEYGREDEEDTNAN